jgi:hypothetical protein
VTDVAYRTRAEKIALVACPTCRAPRGESCLANKGRVHERRVHLAQDVGRGRADRHEGVVSEAASVTACFSCSNYVTCEPHQLPDATWCWRCGPCRELGSPAPSLPFA